jgi:hypothetical protein
MATTIPDFDFSQYNPRDEWSFPPQRLVRFAAEVYTMMTTARTAWTRQYTYPDLRFVVWHELSGHAHALLVGAMHLRSHGDSLEWWKGQPEFDHEFDRRLVAHNNMMVRQMLQLGFVQNVVRQVDIALRQIADSLTHELEEARRPLSEVARDVLKRTDLERYDRLVSLLLIYRDSICQHGRFCPVDGLAFSLVYEGRTYAFEPNKEVPLQAWGYRDTWDFLSYLLVQVKGMFEALFSSDQLQAVRVIRVPYLE